MRTLHQRAGLAVLTLASLACLPGRALALAEVSYEINTYAATGFGHAADLLSAADVVDGGFLPGCSGSCGITGAYAWAGGRADATRLELGMLAIAGSYSPFEGADARAGSYFGNSFVVRSRTLPVGSLANLHLAVALDGTLQVGSSAQTNGSLMLGLIEGGSVPRPGYGEFYQPLMSAFTAAWSLQDRGYGLFTGVGWALNYSEGYDASGYELQGSSQYDSLCRPGDPKCFYSYGTEGVDASGHAIPVLASVHVPLTTVDVSVRVGSTYSIFGALEQAYAGAEGFDGAGRPTLAAADFSHTLKSQLAAADPTVTLEWQIPLAPVPEPGTWSTLTAGLGVLGLLASRRGR